MSATDPKTGGHAFPTLFTEPSIGSGYRGMTLRDWFAGKMIAEMSEKYPNTEDGRLAAAGNAYRYADAMLKARNGGTP